MENSQCVGQGSGLEVGLVVGACWRGIAWREEQKRRCAVFARDSLGLIRGAPLDGLPHHRFCSAQLAVPEWSEIQVTSVYLVASGSLDAANLDLLAGLGTALSGCRLPLLLVGD